MKFNQHYSGSKGNLYEVVANNGERLLIDPGVTWKKLQAALNYDLSNISGALCSHEHKDHCKAVEDVTGAGIDVYASKGTLGALDIPKRRTHELHAETQKIGCFAVHSFRSNHDAVHPLLFIVLADDEALLFATDTSHIAQRFWTHLSIIAIECSYEKAILNKMVKEGKVHEELAKRLINSHMEKDNAIDYLDKYCNLSKCHEIHLLHMSGNHINKEKTRKEFEDKFFIETRII